MSYSRVLRIVRCFESQNGHSRLKTIALSISVAGLLAACGQPGAISSGTTTSGAMVTTLPPVTTVPSIPTTTTATTVPVEPPAGSSSRFNIGTPTVNTLWVDPTSGNDARAGTTRATALRTLTEAWNRVPAHPSVGIQINLVAGSYPVMSIPNYWEAKHGTLGAPIWLRAADGAGTAILAGNVNVFNVSYLYFDGVSVNNSGDAFHCEQCDHVLLRHLTLDGQNVAQETLKVNQSRSMYVEDSIVTGAWDNAIDFVAVQDGQIVGNQVTHAGDWCAYTKGGSARILVEGNTFAHCGTGGFTAGQGTGFEFMTTPWIHYEAYDIRVVNNIVHDTEGAGLGVNGGFRILLAFNTLYRVGSRSHAIEVVQGSRGCDGDVAACQTRRDLGGWGTTDAGGQWIPSKSVYIYGNVVLNPAGFQSRWSHFDIHGSAIPPVASGVPSPSRVDNDLRITDNIFSNGPATLDLGLGADACSPGNLTCTETLLRSENRLNTLVFSLINPSGGNYCVVSTGLANVRPIPEFPVGPALTPSPGAAPWQNAVTTTFSGSTRAASSIPGAC